jgi:hypothetical protein
LEKSVLLKNSTNELLRHFWASLRTPERLDLIRNALKIMLGKIKEFESQEGGYKELVANLKNSVNVAITLKRSVGSDNK